MLLHISPPLIPSTISRGSHVSSPFCVRGTTGFEGLGHGVDVDGGVVGRGQVEGGICPKGGASHSMTAAWRQQLLRRIVLCEWREGQVAQSRPIPVWFRGKYVRGPYFGPSRYPRLKRGRKNKILLGRGGFTRFRETDNS